MTQKLGWGPLKPHAKSGADTICARFNPRVAGGWRPGPAGRPHPSGLAVDFMSYRDMQLGEAMAQFSVANRQALGNIANVIWNRRIASARSSPPWSWRAYTGPNPHIDHVHVEWAESGTAGPIIGDPIGDEEENPSGLDALAGMFRDLSNPENYARLGLFAAGVVLILIAMFRFAFVQNAVKAAGKVAKNAR